MDIGAWLESLGLGRYARVFAENEIDFETLPHLSDVDLKEIGIALGPRRKLMAAIADWSDNQQVAGVFEETPSRPAAGEAEHRQLTVMFVDLVKSMELASRIDPEDLREILSAYQSLVTEITESFAGQVAKYMGDGVLCYFGWPQAHEDDAERAVRAGLAIMREISKLEAPSGERVAARAGIATGKVLVGDLIGQGSAQEEAVIGETPNLAARMQSMAEPGQILITRSTSRLLGNQFDLIDLGARSVKGVAEAVQVYSVGTERRMEFRFSARDRQGLTAMFGRDHELGFLLERWEDAKAGDGQLVVLTGEAGIGKSRVTREIIERLQGEDHFRISYQCSPFHSDSSLQPTRQHLTLASGIADGDSPAEKLDKLERLLRIAEENPSESARLLAWLLNFGEAAEARYGPLDMSPEERRSQLLDALLNQLLGLAERSPVLFILEDAHWIDPTSLELLDLCVTRIAKSRVMILVTARPTFMHEFRGQAFISRLALNRLGRRQMSDIVHRITKGKRLPAEVMEEIAARTDGVPLFIEELTLALLETGDLEEGEDNYRLQKSFEQLKVPSSLQDSLMARLDRLQPVKKVAQTAACIGREFSFKLLKSIAGIDEAELKQALAKLVEAEILFERIAGSETSYLFKHALLQDAAYESLLKSSRQGIHQRLVQVLEEETNTPPQVLAFHASQAGLAEKAIRLWREAGTLAMRQPAYREAAAHFRNALDLIPDLEDQEAWREYELELLVQLGQAYMIAEGYVSDRAVDTYAKARAKIDATENMDLRVAIYYGTWIGPYLRAEHEYGLSLTTRFIKEAEAHEGAIAKLVAHRMRGATLIAMGRSAEALENLDLAFKYYQQADARDFSKFFAQEPGVQIRCYRYLALWFTGFPDQALALAEEATRTARDLGHTNTICYNNFHHSVLGLWCRDPQILKASNDITLEIANEHGMRLWRDYGALDDALLRSQMGEEGSMRKLGIAFQNYKESGCRLWLSFYKAEQAKELLKKGRTEEAQEAIEEAMAFSKSSTEHWADAELLRLRGELNLTNDDAAKAKADFERALQCAKQQKAKMLELRSAVSWARLLYDQGHADDARNLLLPIYESFSEGFGCADMKEAEELLNQLA